MNGMIARPWERCVSLYFFFFSHRSSRDEAVRERSTEDENQPPAALSEPEVADVKEAKVCTVINQKLKRLSIGAFRMFSPL